MVKKKVYSPLAIPHSLLKSPSLPFARPPSLNHTMPYPRVDDDGQTVTLDLHGAPVDEAVRLARRLVREAARRGRRTVKIVHGQSTSNRLYQSRCALCLFRRNKSVDGSKK